MNGHGEKMSRYQEAAINALLQSQSILDAATSAGVAESTLRRWLRDPDFTAAYKQARRDAFGQAIARLQESSSRAVQVLIDVAEGNPTPHNGAKVNAAKAILELAARSIEIEDLAERLEAIEQWQASVERQKKHAA